jgi:maleate cis-trans isomerase
VVTSNQATLWASLRAAGITDTIDEAGILLARH